MMALKLATVRLLSGVKISTVEHTATTVTAIFLLMAPMHPKTLRDAHGTPNSTLHERRIAGTPPCFILNTALKRPEKQV